MGRGMLCYEIQDVAVDFLNREITTTELRLYPYLDYCMKNGGYVDRSKLNRDEQEILEKLENEGYIERCYGGDVNIRKDFYDYMQEVLWISYVETKL